MQREKFIFSLGPPRALPWDTGQAPLSSAGGDGLPVPAAEGTGFDVTVPVHPWGDVPSLTHSVAVLSRTGLWAHPD